MTDRIRIYCDESCHLEHDHIPVMVLGGVWCPAIKSREIAENIRKIKAVHGHHPKFARSLKQFKLTGFVYGKISAVLINE